MSTVLITYPTPPPPSDEPRHRPVDGEVTGGSATGAPTTSVAATTAGIDEAIAATIADELSLVGHQVTCRPCVAMPVTGGYDLVVDVDRLRVTHRGAGANQEPQRRDSLLADDLAVDERVHSGDSTIPMTWGADWRAVDAWARTVGDSLARYLELRSELLRVRTELEQCRELLHAATAPPSPVTEIPEPGSLTQSPVLSPVLSPALSPALTAPVGHGRSDGPGHSRHRHRRLAASGVAREP